MTVYKDISNYDYSDHKQVIFKTIDSINIKEFRSLKDRNFNLAKNITLISGKNGTMKTTILGLIAHPFSSKSKDHFDLPLKTSHSDVFRLSPEKEKDKVYRYILNTTSSKDEKIKTPIKIYYRENNNEKRFRVTVGKRHARGEGNFKLNTSYSNLKRLYPIIETNAAEHTSNTSDNELIKFVKKGYQQIFSRGDFGTPIAVSDNKKRKLKNTFGPSNTYYDYNSISSGEDNLGNILTKMYAFQKNKNTANHLNGIFCIDEIEAGLHPIAQENLFNFMLKWSKKNNIQIVATTHSLYLIQIALDKINTNNEVKLNIISTIGVPDNNYNIIENPDYNTTYKELTFKNLKDLENTYKIPVFCEDDMAKTYLNKIFKRHQIKKHIEIIHGITSDENNPGTSYKALLSLAKNGKKILSHCIFLFDCEIADNIIKKAGDTAIKLPSIFNFPIEKEMVKYIDQKSNDDNFFSHFDKERLSFCNDFLNNNISLEDIDTQNIKNYKNWAKSDRNFNKYLDYYIKEHDFDFFKNAFIKLINKKLKEKSLPILE